MRKAWMGIIASVSIFAGIGFAGREAYCGEIVAYGNNTEIHGITIYDDNGNIQSEWGAPRETPSAPAATAPAASAPAQPAKPKHSHEYESEVTTEPTCDVPGVTTYTCRCGDSYTEEIEALGHQEAAPVVIEPDCVNSGISSVSCERCGEVIFSNVLPAIGHQEGVSERTEPTCTQAGIEVTRCEQCGEVLAEVTLSAIGHTEVVTEVPAKAFSDGLKTTTCSVCGETLKEEVLLKIIPLWVMIACPLGIVLITAVIVILKKKGASEAPKEHG